MEKEPGDGADPRQSDRVARHFRGMQHWVQQSLDNRKKIKTSKINKKQEAGLMQELSLDFQNDTEGSENGTERERQPLHVNKSEDFLHQCIRRRENRIHQRGTYIYKTSKQLSDPLTRGQLKATGIINAKTGTRHVNYAHGTLQTIYRYGLVDSSRFSFVHCPRVYDGEWETKNARKKRKRTNGRIFKVRVDESPSCIEYTHTRCSTRCWSVLFCFFPPFLLGHTTRCCPMDVNAYWDAARNDP